ncbi:hypothetical protein BH11VER1_BH11VER1_06740 [soil metagenome]
MTYKRFEDLPVWQNAIRLAELAEDFLLTVEKRVSRGKQDQLDRCSLSVSNNIAEGFERGTTKELLAFLYIARGSAGEVRSMMRFFERRPLLGDFKSQISDLISLAESCSRQIRAWADSLQNSDIEGPRHLNEKSRGEYEKRKNQKQATKTWDETKREAILKMPEDHPLRVAARRKGEI